MGIFKDWAGSKAELDNIYGGPDLIIEDQRNTTGSHALGKTFTGVERLPIGFGTQVCIWRINKLANVLLGSDSSGNCHSMACASNKAQLFEKM